MRPLAVVPRGRAILFKGSMILALVALTSLQLVGPPAARANAAVMAPVGIKVSLEGLLGALTAAASLGYISSGQEDQFRERIEGVIQEIDDATEATYAAAVDHAALLIEDLHSALNIPTSCYLGQPSVSGELILPAARVEVRGGTRAQPRANVREEVRPCRRGSLGANTPALECCGSGNGSDHPNSFIDRLYRRAQVSGSSYQYLPLPGGAALVRVTINGETTTCCLERDDLHAGFEIFDGRGRHQGEIGCDDPVDNRTLGVTDVLSDS
jgi:hypothetical protein